MLLLAILSVLIWFIGFTVIAVKFFYPKHTMVGLLLMIASVAVFIFSIRKYFKILNDLEYLTTFQAFLLEYRIPIFIFLAVFVVIMTLVITMPFGKNPFKRLSAEKVHKKIKDALAFATIILDHMKIAEMELLNSGLLEKTALTINERETLKKSWENLLMAICEAEAMMRIYGCFYFISVISQPEDHAKAFLIAYSLYLKKFTIVSGIINSVQSHENIKKVLNEKIKSIGIRGGYEKIVEGYYHPKTILRINIGQAYLQTLIDGIYGEKIKAEEDIILLKTAKNDYLQLKNNLGNTVVNSVPIGLDQIEKGIFTLWFPVQKEAAKALGHTYVSKESRKFITIKQINEMKKVMEPGDILLQRRNWYASNIGIPGFWAHAALYTGSLKEMDRYFVDEFPYNGAKKMSELLKREFPAVYKKFQEKTNHFTQAVIEGKEPGIILQPLEISARADYHVTLRPKLDKKDKMLALLRAFGNFGKPYDFNFDFETTDEMVCSELVYDAYLPGKGKNGIHFTLSLVNGRKVMTPIDIAKKFCREYKKNKAELEFVYFLDGDEKTAKAKVKGVDEFIKTIDRPKYSFLLK